MTKRACNFCTRCYYYEIFSIFYETISITLVKVLKCDHVRYLSNLALQVGSRNCRSTPFKDDATLAPKLDVPLSTWKCSSTPLYILSGILNPDQISFCTIKTFQLAEIHYLETRSRFVNTSLL